jgi:Family of unknown function (DUF5302)
MSDSAPRKAPQAGKAQAGKAETSTADSETAQSKAQESGTPGTDSAQAAAGQAPAAPHGDGSGENESESESDGNGAKPDMDEVKRKFREALDRKREVHAEGSGAGGRDSSKIHGTHDRAGGRRSFRRKSG